MKLAQINAIILKKINTGEADKILVVYSRELGKIKIIAKGARKINSRRGPHLEVFSEVSMLIKISKGFSYLGEVSSLYSFTTLHKSFRKIAIAYHLCEILDRLIPEYEKNEYIYDIFSGFLKDLDRQREEYSIRSNVRFFVYDVFSHLGYLNQKTRLTYSQLIGEIENVIERPLATVRLLHAIPRA